MDPGTSEMKLEASDALVSCPSCRNFLKVNREVKALQEDCPVCRSAIDIRVFPRNFREARLVRADRAANQGESTCQFFPDLRAEKACDACGCLMSVKATVDWGDDEVCLPCLHRLREGNASPKFLPKVALHENRALAMVTLLAPLSLMTAPLALAILIRYRNERRSLFSPGRWKWWLALVLSIGWIGVWGAILVSWASLILAEFK